MEKEAVPPSSEDEEDTIRVLNSPPSSAEAGRNRLSPKEKIRPTIPAQLYHSEFPISYSKKRRKRTDADAEAARLLSYHPIHSAPENLSAMTHNDVAEFPNDDIIKRADGDPEPKPPPDTSDQLSLTTRCGIGRHRPWCLQKFASPSWMLFWLCWFCAVQGLLVNGLVPSVLSTIERRFDFTTSMLGRIMQFYDIGYIICCIPMSYFGGRHSKPLFLGIGLLVMGCGSFLFSFPHIVSEAYLTSLSAQNEPFRCSNPLQLSRSSTNSSVASSCNVSEDPKVSDRTRYLFLFCLAHFLHGVGATPLFTLGVSYIDENVKPTLSSVYIGIFYAFAIFGPAFGFLLSGSFLRYHTDFLQAEQDFKITEIDETDPHWVGAWWIGFQLASIFCVLAVFPILSFPKVLPGAVAWHKSRLKKDSPGPVEEAEGGGPSSSGIQPMAVASSPESVVSPTEGAKGSSFWRGVLEDVHHIPRSFLRLFTNAAFMFITLAASVDGLLITGLSAFMSKYLERQFNIRSSRSNMLIGCIMVPVAGLGTMASGYIVKRFRLSCVSTLKFCIAMVVFSLVLSPMFLVYCDHSPLAGLEINYPHPSAPASKQKASLSAAWNGTQNLISGCNRHCDCDPGHFYPVCGQVAGEEVSFYSPCFTGCPERYEPLKQVYSNCSCSGGWRTVKGLCESKCSGLIGFLVLFAPMTLCTFSVGVPALSVVLRCVAYGERSFALGIQWILIRMIGTIPASMLFGWLFDVSCVKRQVNPCSGELGTCFIYNNKLLADLFLAFALIGQTVTLLFMVLALIFYRNDPSREDPMKSPENNGAAF